jgi:uncharacterized membrane protein
MIMDICYYFLIFITYSFIGWALEVIISISKTKKFINRGFLIGPYCPIYGFGSLLITSLLNSYTDNLVVIFVLAMVICMVLEYLTSFIMEKLFKARWWDYTEQRFNINGRVCLETAIPFGIGALIIIYFVHPAVTEIITVMNNTSVLIFSIIIFLLFLVDNIVSFNIISKFKNAGTKIRKDSTEEITKRIKEYLMQQSKLTVRLAKAFPNLQANINIMRLKQKELREELKRKKQELNLQMAEKEYNLDRELKKKQERLNVIYNKKQEKLEKKQNKVHKKK